MKAFTLFETIIVMILSALVVSMAMLVLSMFIGQFSRYEQRTTAAYQLQRTSWLIQEDLDLSKEVEAKGTSFIALLHTGARIKYAYQAEDSILVRSVNNRADTVLNKVYAFNVVFADCENAGQMVASIELDMLLGGEPQRSVFYKNYDVATKINKGCYE